MRLVVWKCRLPIHFGVFRLDYARAVSQQMVLPYLGDYRQSHLGFQRVKNLSRLSGNQVERLVSQEIREQNRELQYAEPSLYPIPVVYVILNG